MRSFDRIFGALLGAIAVGCLVLAGSATPSQGNAAKGSDSVGGEVRSGATDSEGVGTTPPNRRKNSKKKILGSGGS